MKRGVLVTVSGMVGSGKSTTAKHIVDVIHQEGHRAAYWRFQQLPCITLRPKRRAPAASGDRTSNPGMRGEGYRRRRLTASRTLGYLARIAAFQIYRFWRSSEFVITNRYFYDTLVHYDLDGPMSRICAALLHRVVPRPDLALLVVASPQTITARRPFYSREYIDTVDQSYRGLREAFPDLIEVCSEADQRALDRVEAVVRQMLDH